MVARRGRGAAVADDAPLRREIGESLYLLALMGAVGAATFGLSFLAGALG